jgi:alpha-L-fucosidase
MTMNWFNHAGLGVFVHWDHASQQGLEISWPMVGRWQWPGYDAVNPESDDVTVAQYQSSAATFNPARWDPAALAKRAKALGAKYVVFTTKHAAGYSMFHTRHSDFSIEHSPYQRDLTREFVDAVRAEGLRVGLYYSLADWHHPGYPAWTDADRPYSRDGYRRAEPEDWATYLRYMHDQLTELLTNYGRIDLLWFDGDWERSAEEWCAGQLRMLCKSLQPRVIINDRLPGYGDYTTPEQVFPTDAPAGPWELCMTMSESWGYRPADHRRKTARQLAERLCEVSSKGGNLLLNIGPDGDGVLPDWQIDRLDELTDWTARHGEAVLGVRPGSKNLQFYGPVTETDDSIYLHLVLRPAGEVVARGLPVKRIRGVRLLATGEQLTFRSNVEVHNGVVPAEPTGELFIDVPAASGALIDVIAVDLGAPGTNVSCGPA